MRIFELIRDVDETGVSGTGRVAQGRDMTTQTRPIGLGDCVRDEQRDWLGFALRVIEVRGEMVRVRPFNRAVDPYTVNVRHLSKWRRDA